MRLRLIAATNEALIERVAAGLFRKDLYYRLAVMTFELPPLASQPELIDALIEQQLHG